MPRSSRSNEEFFLREINKNLGPKQVRLVVPGASNSDQAGRSRVSMPVPLGDYKLLNDNLPLFFDTQVNGTATVTHNAARKAHDMQTAATGDWAIVQTYQAHNYFAGKSQFIEITSFEFEADAISEKRTGYYSSNRTTPFQSNLDGFYLYTDGVTHYLRIMNNGFEILNIPRADWDDPLDGTGPSGYNISWKDFNVFQASFLWLGGTGLNLMLVVGRRLIAVHDYEHIGSSNDDKLMFSSPNKPLRHELIQTGAGASQFQPVCGTIATEGSDSTDSIGISRGIDVGAADIITASAGTRYPVKGIRLKDTHLDEVVDIIDISLFVETSNDNFLWGLSLNPTIVGSPVWGDVSNSSVQESSGDGVLTISDSGSVLACGYGSSSVGLDKSLKPARKLGAAIDGVRDEIWLFVEPITGSNNLNVFGSIIYKQFN